MEEVIWNIAGPILAVVCVILGVYFAIQALQAFRNQDEHSVWKNAIIFFICFGIAYRNRDFVELVKSVWDKIPLS